MASFLLKGGQWRWWALFCTSGAVSPIKQGLQHSVMALGKIWTRWWKCPREVLGSPSVWLRRGSSVFKAKTARYHSVRISAGSSGKALHVSEPKMKWEKTSPESFGLRWITALICEKVFQYRCQQCLSPSNTLSLAEEKTQLWSRVATGGTIE